LDTLRHRVTRGGRELDLTNREYELLEFLMRHSGQIVTRTMLAEHVWEYDFDPLSNVIDVHIARLRRKIDEGFTAKLLHTVRGSGYILQLPDTSQDVPEGAHSAEEHPASGAQPQSEL
jgi:two-component system OmpR family response regulator